MRLWIAAALIAAGCIIALPGMFVAICLMTIADRISQRCA